MYKNILIPVVLNDANPPVKAFETARELAGSDTKITLLHVIEELPGYATSYVAGDYIEQSKKAVSAKLDALAANVEGTAGVVLTGHSSRTILDYAEKNGTDCIIVSSHKPGVQDYFLGGTAARVVRYASCAVHVIR